MLYCSEADLTPHFKALITLRPQRRNRRELHLPTPAQGCTGKKVQAELCGTLSILGYYSGGLSPHSVPSLLFLEGPGTPPSADLSLTPSEKSPPIPESPEEEVREASNISALEPFLTGVEVPSGLGLYVTPTDLR